MMAANYLGSLTLGGAMPQSLTAVAALTGSINLELPSIAARLEGLLAAQASITISPPTLATRLTAALGIVAALQAAIELGLPTIDGNLFLIAGLIADLQVELGALQANLALASAFDLQLGNAGVHAYTYTGRADGLVPGVSSVIGAALPGGDPSDHVGAIVLAASAPATKVAMGAWFGVTFEVE
jgi:hypothetical protein